MNELLPMAISVALVNHLLLREQRCAAAIGETSIGQIGPVVALISTLATPLMWMIERTVLAPLTLSSLNLQSSLVIIALLVFLSRSLVTKLRWTACPNVLLALNALMLYGAQTLSPAESLTQASVNGAAVGLTFWLALVLLETFIQRIQLNAVAAWMRGSPLYIIGTGLICLSATALFTMASL